MFVLALALLVINDVTFGGIEAKALVERGSNFNFKIPELIIPPKPIECETLPDPEVEIIIDEDMMKAMLAEEK